MNKFIATSILTLTTLGAATAQITIPKTTPPTQQLKEVKKDATNAIENTNQKIDKTTTDPQNNMQIGTQTQPPQTTVGAMPQSTLDNVVEQTKNQTSEAAKLNTLKGLLGAGTMLNTSQLGTIGKLLGTDQSKLDLFKHAASFVSNPKDLGTLKTLIKSPAIQKQFVQFVAKMGKK